MKLLTILITLMLTTSSFAFTLVSNPPVFFSDTKVKINVSNDACDQSGFTAEDILSKAGEAADIFWNSATTSALELEKGEVISTSLGTVDLAGALAASSTNTILIVCSSHADLTATTGGIGGISSSGGEAKGALIINNAVANTLSNLGDQGLLTLLAHEMGHALGLHHSSSVYALMHYTLDGKTQEYLSQDDIDGITYLYPHEKELGGLIGSCGTITLLDDKSTDFWDGPAMVISSAILGFLGLLTLNTLISRLRSFLLRRFARYSSY